MCAPGASRVGVTELSAGTALLQGGSANSITGQAAVGTVGRENSNLWKQVN